MPASARDLLGKLRGVKASGEGSWMAFCPAHDDKKSRSLSVAERGDRVLLNCFAGCEPASVLRAVGLELQDLFDDDGVGFKPKKAEPEPETPYGCTLDQLASKTGLPPDFLRCADIRAEETQCWVSEDVGMVAAVRLPYTAEDGKELGAKFRVKVAGGDKYRAEKGAKLALYGQQFLPAARQTGKLILVEGETDCWTLWKHGIPACGVPGTASTKVLKREHLEGIRQLYVVEEQDEAGAKFPGKIAERVANLGGGPVVLRVRLDAKDPNDLFKLAPERFKSRFLTTCLHARGLRTSKLDKRRFVTARELHRMEFPPIRWVVPGMLSEGIGLLFSAPKTGKSWLAIQLAMAVSANIQAFDHWRVEAGEVLVIDKEQVIGPQMQQRFNRHGARQDRNRCCIFDEWSRLDQGGLEEIDIWLEERPACRLVVVDVWSNIKPQTPKGMNSYDAEYRTLQQLRRVMLRRRACCLLVHHDKKNDGSASITEAASGSKALTGAANVIWWLRRPIGEGEGTLTVTGRDVPEMELPAYFNGQHLAWSIEQPIELA